MSTRSEMTPRQVLACLLGLFLAVATVTAGHADLAAAKGYGGKRCGKREGASLIVTKGGISCETVRNTFRDFHGVASGSNCGRDNGGHYPGACAVGRFHCRNSANARDTDHLWAYCWILKSNKPASADNSFYQPRKFKKAFVWYFG